MRRAPTCCATVCKSDHTVTTFPRCTIDEFTVGDLTVSSTDTGDEVRTFVRGTWREAIAYDERGNVLIAFTAMEASNGQNT